MGLPGEINCIVECKGKSQKAIVQPIAPPMGRGWGSKKQKNKSERGGVAKKNQTSPDQPEWGYRRKSIVILNTKNQQS